MCSYTSTQRCLIHWGMTISHTAPRVVGPTGAEKARSAPPVGGGSRKPLPLPDTSDEYHKPLAKLNPRPMHAIGVPKTVSPKKRIPSATSMKLARL
mmetsp:Transcript_84524/g.154932  ORF Transcript_84524/g.154932 Transcript_84524/m.154932 type:complete len:96 (+) Transcript_84524:1-288(+)